MRASAVVCTKDRGDLIAGCLESLAASLGPDDELIVVEAGDSSCEDLLATLGGSCHKRHIRADRPGKSHQLNLGIAAARGEVLLFTDDDVRVGEAWAGQMVEALADPRYGIACGRVTGLTMAPGWDRPHLVPAGDAPLETWHFAHGAAMAARREAALQAGGFDERLGPGRPAVGEDHDFLIRVRDLGWRVTVAGADPVRHEEWRTPEADRSNALAYERGGGAIVGAALRRRSPDAVRLLRARLGYQRRLIHADRRFGWRGLAAFAGGLLYGLRLAPAGGGGPLSPEPSGRSGGGP